MRECSEGITGSDQKVADSKLSGKIRGHCRPRRPSLLQSSSKIEKIIYHSSQLSLPPPIHKQNFPERRRGEKSREREREAMEIKLDRPLSSLRCFSLLRTSSSSSNSVTFSVFSFIFFLILIISAASADFNVTAISFNEGYSPLFGDDNVVPYPDGTGVRLVLNPYTGAFIYVY